MTVPTPRPRLPRAAGLLAAFAEQAELLLLDAPPASRTPGARRDSDVVAALLASLRREQRAVRA